MGVITTGIRGARSSLFSGFSSFKDFWESFFAKALPLPMGYLAASFPAVTGGFIDLTDSFFFKPESLPG